MKISTKRFVLSDETRNSYGFITITAGIDLSDFEANPVMLYDHDFNKVIGQWTDLKIEGTQLTGVPSFDENDPEAMKQYSKVEQGILKGASVGLSPVQFDEVAAIMFKSNLKEASLTPVPSNRKALTITLYNTKGVKLSDNEAKQFLLSLTQTEILHNNKTMTPKMITALVALCLQAGHTVNLSAQPGDEEIEGAINKVKEKLTTLSAENLGFKNQLTLAKHKEITDLVDAAITDKRLSADLKADFVALGNSNLVTLKAVLGGMKAVEIAALPGDQKDKPVNPDTAKLSWTFDDYAEKAPGELETMEAKNPTLFKKLTDEKIAKLRNTHSIEA